MAIETPPAEIFYTAKDKITDILKSIPKRILILISKIFSAKFLVFGTACYFLYEGKINQYGYIVIACVFLFGKSALQVIDKIKK